MNKVNVLFAICAIIFVFSVTDANAAPLDIYDEIDNSNDKFLLNMAELIDSINSDDSDDDSGRLVNGDSGSSSASNELKEMKPIERCMLPVRKGVCRALIPRFSYNSTTKDCQEFKFGGCDGNGNNFSTHKQCMDVCDGL